MANIASQKKRILRTERERLENRRYTSTIKTYFRRLETAVQGGDDAAADAEHRAAVRELLLRVRRHRGDTGRPAAPAPGPDRPLRSAGELRADMQTKAH